jgi:pyridoxamine 5'-phosphate oxidase family protein
VRPEVLRTNEETEIAFTDEEAAFLHANTNARTGSIATTSADGQPDVVAVSYEFDGTFLYIGGLNQLTSRKYRNVVAGNSKVAFFLEERTDAPPLLLKWMRIYGTADIVDRKGRFDSVATGGAEDRESSKYIRITPSISWGFNLEGRQFGDFDVENYKNRDSVRRNVHGSAEKP